MERFLKALIILVISTSSLPAQVKLMLDYNARTNEYTVSMMPEKTWQAPDNLTATGQITLKATTGQFYVKDVKSLVPDTDWFPSGRVNAPNEQPGYDYIFFRLDIRGLAEVPYQAFVPTRLFSFQLESNCAKEVMLVSNFEDKFLPPNSRRINIGNSIGVSGANGEAYAGNISDIPIFCAYASTPSEGEETSTNKPLLVEEEVFFEKKLLYPNPTIDEVNVELNWSGIQGEKTILAYNNNGELVRFFNQNLDKGNNEFALDLKDLASGVYNFLLVEKGQSLSLGQIIKVQ